MDRLCANDSGLPTAIRTALHDQTRTARLTHCFTSAFTKGEARSFLPSLCPIDKAIPVSGALVPATKATAKKVVEAKESQVDAGGQKPRKKPVSGRYLRTALTDGGIKELNRR
jgi:hypothetical protein